MIYFITGASGAGKTTLLEYLKKKFLHKGWRLFNFDSIGVPSLEEMIKKYGSASNWQEAMTNQWIDKLIHEHNKSHIIIEGQMNLKFIQDRCKKHSFKDYKIILLDCSEEEMIYRLKHKRNQPELITEDMKNWLKFLRQQADELDIKLVNTENMSMESIVDILEDNDKN